MVVCAKKPPNHCEQMDANAAASLKNAQAPPLMSSPHVLAASRFVRCVAVMTVPSVESTMSSAAMGKLRRPSNEPLNERDCCQPVWRSSTCRSCVVEGQLAHASI